MKARRDEIRVQKREEEITGEMLTSTRSLPGIYARFDDLGVEELQLLANRYQKSTSQEQLNPRGKYHIQYMKDTYPIAGSQLKLEKEREMEIAAKKKMLLAGEVEQVQRAEAERRIRLSEVHHREGMEQFWKLMHAAPTRDVIAWLKFHSFLDVNIPVRLVSGGYTDEITVQEDRTSGITPLMAACRSFQHVHSILVDLLGLEVDVNAQNTFGETALHFCARYGLYDCAKLLLQHGADPFIHDRKGVSAVEHLHDTTVLLNQQRGTLAATWSQNPEHFFTNLKVEQARAGHLRNQYIDSRGQVIVCPDEDE
eukprot:jgi/Phyca11/8649/fgenesh1_pm.PHYCAscaffold_30_\